MKKKETSMEELTKALEYLDSFSKGKATEPIAPAEKKEEAPAKPAEENPSEGNGGEEEPDDELYAAHKKRMTAYIDKAMCHKGYMESIKKGDPLPDEAFDDLDDEPAPAEAPKEEPKKEESAPKEEPKEAPAEAPIKKGGESETLEKGAQVDELVKAKVAEEISSVKAHYEEVIKGLEDKISKISDEPVRKTLIKGADAVTLKAAIAGEKVDDKTILSISLQKGKVSEALYNAYEAEQNAMTKGILGEAVSQFECTGNFISAEVAEIMDSKGVRFIQ